MLGSILIRNGLYRKLAIVRLLTLLFYEVEYCWQQTNYPFNIDHALNLWDIS